MRRTARLGLTLLSGGLSRRPAVARLALIYSLVGTSPSPAPPAAPPAPGGIDLPVPEPHVRPDRARPDHESFKHVAVSYDSNAAFLRLTVPRVRAALAHDRRVIVATSADKLRLLDEALGDEARQIDRRD